MGKNILQKCSTIDIFAKQCSVDANNKLRCGRFHDNYGENIIEKLHFRNKHYGQYEKSYFEQCSNEWSYNRRRVCFTHFIHLNKRLFTIYFLLHRAVIENCIICDKAIIRAGCILKNCLVGPNHEVAANTNKEKVHLTNADGYMEIE